MRWDFASIVDNSDALLVGAAGTLRLFAICLVLGLSLGLVVGLGRYARNPLLHWPATAFVEFFRNTPVLVQILWFYFALPMLLPFEISPLMAAAFGISLNSAAFSAEIYRGGLLAIHFGQFEAAKALNLSRWHTFVDVVAPQMIRVALPSSATYGIGLFKESAIASTIGVQELAYQANYLAQTTFRGLEVFGMVGLVYILISLPIAWLSRILDRRIRARVAR